MFFATTFVTTSAQALALISAALLDEDKFPCCKMISVTSKDIL